LDALASDRQYRRALPLDQAMAKVASESGTSFDPAVVRALEARYEELEARAKANKPKSQASLSTDIKITRGSAPAAGYEAEPQRKASARPALVRTRVFDATQGRVLEMPHAASSPVCAEEALAVASVRIQNLIGYDALAIFHCEGGILRAKFVTGENSRLLRSLTVPEGHGLVGWVAEVGKPILNGNPAVEPGFDLSGSSLSSALAVPLTNSGRTIGVMALYRTEPDAFAGEELVTLLELCSGVAEILCDDVDEPRKTQAVAAYS